MPRDLALHFTRVKALPPSKDAIVDDVQQRVDVDQTTNGRLRKNVHAETNRHYATGMTIINI